MHTRAATGEDDDAYARLMPELGVDDPVPSRERFAIDLAAGEQVVDPAGRRAPESALYNLREPL